MEISAFRNYASLSFAPDAGLNVLIGHNGQGKTSLLEALHVLLTGRSFRTARLVECVGWGRPQAVVAGEIADGERHRPVRLTLQAEGGVESVGTAGTWARAVAFGAADLALLSGGPAGRRAYLDGAAVRLAPTHADTCRRYRLVLYQRGRLLARLAGRPDVERLLAPWDEQVATLGSEILHRRLETLTELRRDAGAVWRALAPEGAQMELAYAPAVAPGADTAASRDRLLAALAAGRRQELARGATLVGPHRDDLLVSLDGVEARIYASRGEQRLLVLALRLAEAAAVRRQVGVTPVLLLDDLMSELDRGARERVLDWLAGQGQVVFSATDPAGAGVVWDVCRGEVEALHALAGGGAA
jgi:DNA replication and repair protein RecF